MRKKFLNRRINGGYTIIETMVAISLFLVVTMAGMGALLNANLLHGKSEDMRSIVDNLSFIMEEMGRNLRTGTDYHCIDGNSLPISEPHSCEKGEGISFRTALGDQWIYLMYSDGSLGKSINGGSSYTILTPPEIVLDPVSGFSVLGAEPPPDSDQPFVRIQLDGKIIEKGVTSPFSLQTSVSQRAIDIDNIFD